MSSPKPVVLVICDGLGTNLKDYGNAVNSAKKPNFDNYWKNYPTTQLLCSGKNVGLPPGTIGNSEVGHIHIGAGKSVFQPLQMINNAIDDESFFKNEQLLSAVNHCKKNNSDLHLMGLFSNKGVHATTEHLHALLEFCKREKFENVFIHPILDGRDVPEKSYNIFLEALQKAMKKTGTGKIATICGRFYAMDRDQNYDRTKTAYDLYTKGEAVAKETDPLEAVKNAYKRGDPTDYYVKPILMIDKDTKKEIGLVKKNDAIIFTNYRSDRARQITEAFAVDKFEGFKREKIENLKYICMSEYNKAFGLPVAYKQIVVTENLGKILADNGKKQLRIAETEKYAHVTFFFNSQIDAPNKGEDRIMVLSPKVASYDLKPEMSAYEVTEKLCKAIESGKYDCVMVNYANCDLVGHSGVFDAAKKAVEVVDECVGKVVKSTDKMGGITLITADHGNAEEMLFDNGEKNPAHTTNVVPFSFIYNGKDEKLKNIKLKSKEEKAELIDITPTILKLLGITKHKDMNGTSLF